MTTEHARVEQPAVKEQTAPHLDEVRASAFASAWQPGSDVQLVAVALESRKS